MKIKLSRGATVNMGNYESYRFDVGIEEDFDSDKFNVREAYEWAAKEIDTLFDKEMKEAKRQAK